MSLNFADVAFQSCYARFFNIRRLYFHSKEGVLRIFIARKYPSLLLGLNLIPFIPGICSDFCVRHRHVKTGSGAHPQVPGSSSPTVKWSGHEAVHSPPFSAEVKNAWSYTSSTSSVFMAWY
jgi:hypothetical protein